MLGAPENTLPLILSVALLFISSCVTVFIVFDVFISPAGGRWHVVRLRSSGATSSYYGVYQHCKLHRHSVRDVHSSAMISNKVRVRDQLKYHE